MKSILKIGYGISAAAVVLFILAVGVASVADFHADGRYHDDCPLCRFNLDGHMLRIHAAWTTAKPLIFHSPLFLFTESAVCRPVNFGIYLPNAPPSSPVSPIH